MRKHFSTDEEYIIWLNRQTIDYERAIEDAKYRLKNHLAVVAQVQNDLAKKVA